MNTVRFQRSESQGRPAYKPGRRDRHPWNRERSFWGGVEVTTKGAAEGFGPNQSHGEDSGQSMASACIFNKNFPSFTFVMVQKGALTSGQRGESDDLIQPFSSID